MQHTHTHTQTTCRRTPSRLWDGHARRLVGPSCGSSQKGGDHDVVRPGWVAVNRNFTLRRRSILNIRLIFVPPAMHLKNAPHEPGPRILAARIGSKPVQNWSNRIPTLGETNQTQVRPKPWHVSPEPSQKGATSSQFWPTITRCLKEHAEFNPEMAQTSSHVAEGNPCLSKASNRLMKPSPRMAEHGSKLDKAAKRQQNQAQIKPNQPKRH